MNMNDLPLVVNAKLVAIMLEECIPNLTIGMVSDQIEEYKAKLKLLKASGQATEEMEALLMLSESAIDQGESKDTIDEGVRETMNTSDETGSESLDRSDGTGRTVEDKISNEEKDSSFDSEWADLIQERRT